MLLLPDVPHPVHSERDSWSEQGREQHRRSNDCVVEMHHGVVAVFEREIVCSQNKRPVFFYPPPNDKNNIQKR